MGYRLWIEDKDDERLGFYGTKLYGYVRDERKLRSYEYLVRIGKFDGNETFTYGYDNEIELTAEEFKKFAEAYDEDYYDANDKDKDCPRGWFVGNPDIAKLMASDADKIVSWG